MMKQRIYIDTSVIGGCFDEEFKEWSLTLLGEFVKGEKTMLVSDLMMRELENARKEVKEKINEVPEKNRFNLFSGNEVTHLARKYIDEGALTRKSYNDALHIALATINNADVLASWNFKHIVNLNKIRLFNSINIKLGYHWIEIRTPREIVEVKEI